MTGKNFYNRHSIRLSYYDYSSPGEYFITICTYNKESMFGEIMNGEMQRNTQGEIVFKEWNNIPYYYANIELDEYIIMPNHIHGIIIINPEEAIPQLENPVGAIHESPLPNNSKNELPLPEEPYITESPLPNNTIITNQYKRRIMTLPKIIGRFKMVTAKIINLMQNTPGTRVWQRNYYEHIIRGEKDLDNIRDYIQNNPLKWQEDEENIDNYKKRANWDRKKEII